MKFYFALFLQLVGLAMVGVCLFAGLIKGDYGKLELLQFIVGPVLFSIGRMLLPK